MTDGKRALQFYRDVLGLSERKSSSRETNQISLGSAGGTELVVLHPGSTGPFPRNRTGLYHYALAVPDLKELARVVARLASLNVDQYPTDHVVSKSDYIWDPDGNGIEIYKETPEEVQEYKVEGNNFIIRDKNGVLRSGRDPLDLDWLYSHLASENKLEQPIPGGTTMGHIHLHVADLDSSLRFYSDVLGYDRYIYGGYLGFADLTLGTYKPHRIAVNTWASAGAHPAPPDLSGLRYYTIVLPKKSDLDRVIDRIEQSGAELPGESRDEDDYFVMDPSRNRVRFTVKG